VLTPKINGKELTTNETEDKERNVQKGAKDMYEKLHHFRQINLKNVKLSSQLKRANQVHKLILTQGKNRKRKKSDTGQRSLEDRMCNQGERKQRQAYKRMICTFLTPSKIRDRGLVSITVLIVLNGLT
jgi:hypothetical protein